MTTRKKRKRKIAKGRVAAAVLLALAGIVLILLGIWALLHPNGMGLGLDFFTASPSVSQIEDTPPTQQPQTEPEPVLALNPLTGIQTWPRT